MTKIAQVLAGGARGGAENFFTRLVQGVHGTGHIRQHAFIRDHIHLVSALKKAGIATTSFRFGGPLHILDRHRYTQALSQYEPDVVLTWMNRATKLTPTDPHWPLCTGQPSG